MLPSCWNTRFACTGNGKLGYETISPFSEVGLLIGLSLLIAFLLLKELYFTAVMCFIILLGTAFSLYQDQRKMLQKMEHLIANIHYGDMNLSFPIPSTDGPEANLTRAMNEALSAFRTRLYNVVVAEAETEAWQKLNPCLDA